VSDLQAELEVATDLVRQAGRVLLEIYATDFGVSWKTERDPVTEADRRANALLEGGLRARFPGDGVVAEESADHGDALQRSRCWFVDPLDGTKEFIAKNGEFSIMLGLAIDGRAALGVVYQPVGDKLYRGVCAGAGAMAELIQNGVRQALRVSETADPAGLRLVVSRSHRPKETSELMARLGIAQERPSGSVGLKVGLIAERAADLYAHFSDRSSRWDACAPEAILHGAGGRFSDLLGRPLDYRAPGLGNDSGLLACNAEAHAAVLKVVREIATASGFE
jgi:3'(2'), 5'-bisphosphate nucleotidase